MTTDTPTNTLDPLSPNFGEAAHDGQAARVMDLLEGTTFTPAQKAQILSATEAVGFAARVMDLLEGTTLTPDQKTRILSAPAVKVQQEQARNDEPSSLASCRCEP